MIVKSINITCIIDKVLNIFAFLTIQLIQNLYVHIIIVYLILCVRLCCLRFFIQYQTKIKRESTKSNFQEI